MRTKPNNAVLPSLAVFSSICATAAALVTSNNLPTGWTYQGCYTEVGGRTINSASFVDAKAMTGAACVNFCSAKGFPYAGTEYSSECYCGSSLAAGTTKAPDTDCNMACAGNGAEACGAGGRLTLYTNPNNKGPQPNTGVANWPYIGCYTEGTTGRALGFQVNIPAASMSASACTAACQANGYILAGTEYSGECHCGNTIANGGAAITDGSCNMICNGNSTEYCGGPNRLNVYDYKMMFPVAGTSASSTSSTPSTPSTSSTAQVPAKSPVSSSTAAAAASATPTAPSQPAAVGNYKFYSCWTETPNNGGRALGLYAYADDAMTLESCQAFCSAKGTTYFGTEYGRECYCGNSFTAGSVAAPAGDCNKPCAGNQWEFCGNGNRLSVYSKNGNAPVSSGTTAAPTSTSSTSSAVAAATGFPDGWTAQGCWQDGPNGRIMQAYQAPDSQTLTQQSCAQLCASKGYSISGTEYFTQCFCDNAIYNGGVKGTDNTKCNSPCSGDNTQNCGGPGYLTIYSKGTPQTFQPPTAQLGGLNGTWTYQGCYEDNLNNARTLPWALQFPGTMTPAMCLGRCAQFGYAAAGLEYGQECYCGDPGDIKIAGATKRPDTECNVACAGNASAICGGGSRLTTYFWTGSTPLYVFNYPALNGAGSGTYSNLVGGVVTPLMTMQSITGKVTFLEKGGTGAPNSTGAYELDLSQVNNFAQAWRTMHVQTDIFCSAGIILPDKAARQLTIGGWSLDSTYGVRLYWPDGSAGVPGVNDWQEDNANLRLQQGRWYPSAMIMANGSVLVLGGETGSNAAAVPTLEILPPTGTKPLYMDWLARTDPNNLYPFMAVLPQGGIFVGYWNEARILDENTFATTKTLPNIPGAVNDDYGGRTYPLEGTAMLLPQYAPYTDPLGILMCGGSTVGHEALDNCASIYPQAANPQWVLERMPSKRVMSCMAALPDGTYLIANGAMEGVAGFGLADNPNYNALLYDPRKPIGTRISVMANTTVARLYHSEAITLLDGRVLITGSDPQDGKHPEEMRVEVFTPPYLYSTLPRPTFTVTNKDWSYTQSVAFTLGTASQNPGGITVSLLGAVSSTHGNSMGARTLFPAVTCTGTTCTVVAPLNAHVAPPGWYQMFVLDGGIPAVGVYVRIGGDPAQVGNWPPGNFKRPGV